MKAVVWTAYGPPDVLVLKELPKPTPGDDEVLVKIRAATVFPGDCELRRFEMAVKALWLPLRAMFGFRKPRGDRVLGQEFAGEIEAVGKDVRRFAVGDHIFAATDFRMGGNSQYVSLAADGAIALKPPSLSFEQAAAIPVAGLNALHFLWRGDIRPGERVLINGAGGTIGTSAVQIAKSLGAEITGVDTTHKLAALRDLGVDDVIDYTEQDFTKNGESYDVILDIAVAASQADAIRSLRPGGRYLLVDTLPLRIIKGWWTTRTTDKRVVCELVRPTARNLDRLAELVESGDFLPVIDKTYPLAEAVDAHRYVESGQKIGHVVLSVDHD